jgi:hypothetical protein
MKYSINIEKLPYFCINNQSFQKHFRRNKTLKRKQLPFSKRHLFALLAFVLLTFASSLFADDRVTVIPFISEDAAIFLPLRSSAEQLGFEVSWDAVRQRAIIEKGNYSWDYRLTDNHPSLRIIQDRVYVLASRFLQEHGLHYANHNADQILLYSLAYVSTVRMYADLELIASTPRPILSNELATVESFITSRLSDLGYDVEVQPVHNRSALLPIGHQFHNPNATPAILGRNIIARKDATLNSLDADILILTASYDSFGFSPGANGNASGVVGLLELAYLVKDIPSELELHFLFLTAEAGGAGTGTLQYLRFLTAEQIERIVGVIGLSTIASLADAEIILYTLDGESNSISDLFLGLETKKEKAPLFTFYGVTIPALLISEDITSESHFIGDRENDRIEIIDMDKMQFVVTRIANVLAYLLSDSSPSLRSPNRSDLEVEPLGKGLILSEPIAFNEVTRTQIEHHIGRQLLHRPTPPLLPSILNSSFVTYLDWWGVALETHFQFSGFDHLLSGISVIIPDITLIIPRLDELYTRIETPSDFSFPNLPLYPEEVEVQARSYWRSDYGNAFILEQRGEEFLLLLSNYVPH